MHVTESFAEAGEAMLLAQEGQRQIVAAIVEAGRNAHAGLKTWLASMPTSLPPTEPRR